MSIVAGQSDIFDALGEPAPTPAFKVWTCVWSSDGCGWCRAKSSVGGGACRNPGNADESLFYEYCAVCVKRWGHPSVRDMQLIIDRTKTERPGNAPNLPRKE